MGGCLRHATLAFLIINILEIFGRELDMDFPGSYEDAAEEQPGNKAKKADRRQIGVEKQYGPRFSDTESVSEEDALPDWYVQHLEQATEDVINTTATEQGDKKGQPAKKPTTKKPGLQPTTDTTGETAAGGEESTINNDNLTPETSTAIDTSTQKVSDDEWVEYNKQYEAMWNRMWWEKKNKVQHYPGKAGYPPASVIVNKVCYYIGTTYLNAIQDIRRYYRFRYIYSDNLEYEMGYVIHEIVYRYTIVLELYHTVQARFENVTQHSDLAAPTYMVYMYTHILQQCQQIIHYCNALGEIEKKYIAFPTRTVFDDEGRGKGGVNTNMSEIDYMKSQQEEQRLQQIKLQKHYEKLRKQRLKQQKKDEAKLQKLGLFSTTTRSLRPKSYNYFPHHYGWSIELF